MKNHIPLLGSVSDGVLGEGRNLGMFLLAISYHSNLINVDNQINGSLSPIKSHPRILFIIRPIKPSLPNFLFFFKSNKLPGNTS